ncbi:MAG: dihydroorotate dehydrogenase electron transfer subunit [Defluviitaleaceae bacterium]|nr:dihydroorotate dehydrogenase electron transfer subunit [Defluviitaleaceae bacterium]
MKGLFYGEVLENRLIAPDIYDMRLHAPDAVAGARAGQFISLYTGDAAMLLPRPLSICQMDPSCGIFRVVYKVAGQGTEKLAALCPGDELRGLAPLGSFYQIDENHRKFAIVGGGMGAPPMLGLACQIRHQMPDTHISVYLGFRDNSQVILADDFGLYADEVIITTDDGSFGIKGNAIAALPEKPDFDAVFGCGPHAMLKYLAKYAREKGLPCHVSLEERMACSIGACLACVTKTEKGLAKVCAAGPVFDAKEVVWT